MAALTSFRLRRQTYVRRLLQSDDIELTFRDRAVTKDDYDNIKDDWLSDNVSTH